MFPVNFKKERAEYFMQCLSKGALIGSVQTVDEMVALAGACFFAISTHGPLLRKAAAEMQGKTLELSETSEHAEADTELVYNNLHAAIEFVGHLTMLVHDGQYDETYEESVQCGVSQDGESKQIFPLAGFKKKPQ